MMEAADKVEVQVLGCIVGVSEKDSKEFGRFLCVGEAASSANEAWGLMVR